MLVTLKNHDTAYPQKMLKLFDVKPTLTVFGNVSILSSRSVSIIGSRNPTKYAYDVVTNMVESLCAKDITIVSGLASGVDEVVHTQVLRHSGKTIGILGFGFDYLTSFENYNLVKDIVQKGGCVVSPFKNHQIPHKNTFIERNKIIAALSDCLLIVEATAKSGTHHTASAALDFGVPVLAVPGNIFSKNAVGVHNLIKSGAQICTCPDDILTLIDFDKRAL